MSRQSERRAAFRTHKVYKSPDRFVVLCPWCLKEIEVGSHWDLHEWLVKRSGVTPANHPLIMVNENCVPVHYSCHSTHGQSRTMQIYCLALLSMTVGVSKIGKWYTSLWSENNVMVPKGTLYPPSAVPMQSCLRFIETGLAIMGSEGDVDRFTESGYDLRALVVLRWKGKKKLPEEPGNQPILAEALEVGYWLDYLAGIIEASAEEIIERVSTIKGVLRGE